MQACVQAMKVRMLQAWQLIIAIIKRRFEDVLETIEFEFIVELKAQ